MKGFSVVGRDDFGNVARPLIRQAPPATFSLKGRRKKKAPPSERRGLIL